MKILFLGILLIFINTISGSTFDTITKFLSMNNYTWYHNFAIGGSTALLTLISYLLLKGEFKKNILFKSLLFPHETEKKYFVAGGHWHHNELQIDSLYSLRPAFDVSDYSTPIDGLFICGAGTHPGGNLFGLSGLNAAKKILRESSK